MTVLFSLSDAGVGPNPTNGGATFGPMQDVLAPAGAISRVVEYAMMYSGAATQQIGLAYSATVSVQTGGGQKLNAEDQASSQQSKATLYSTWTTAPTLGTITPNFMRRAKQVGAAGGVIWTFIRGIRLAPAGVSLALWNIDNGSGTPAAWWMVVEESQNG